MTTTRRGALTGLGAAGLGLAGLAATAQPAVADSSGRSGLPVLAPVDGNDWTALLAETPRVQLVPGATYVLDRTADLPDECLIEGNGAIVTVAGGAIGALAATSRRNVTIRGVRFLGQDGEVVNAPAEFGHVGLRLTRCTNVRVLDCDFQRWRGAGVVVTGAAADNYFDYRVKLQGNSFERCYIGVSLADRSEYSLLSDNHFSYCRLGIWSSSGNWTVTGNVLQNCYGAYYAIAATSPYGALAADNWNHGSVVGNTFNHSNGSGGSVRWTTNLAFPVGGVDRDPGRGVTIEGLLPPTFTGNTLWYTDVRASRLVGTRWLLSGCTFSNLTITGDGAVPVHLVGTQANGAANLPRLVGNVVDLLPWP
ncbi:right-handed parallel beta-helix repeat-containing protein [Nocardioides allogilvus]|uniref:right-handed parallel beta-helix repeat-containing protein n=1 Tax=Nocardioides allogilvus TaxID=2072017 RepID=UPI000D31E166|nr:right-handed parallel beta-helix repeat-containing protein [Nocardioides allogilvus]